VAVERRGDLLVRHAGLEPLARLVARRRLDLRRVVAELGAAVDQREAEVDVQQPGVRDGQVAAVGELVDEVDAVVAEPAGDRAAQLEVAPEQAGRSGRRRWRSFRSRPFAGSG
jgi:hypothetical protein